MGSTAFLMKRACVKSHARLRALQLNRTHDRFSNSHMRFTDLIRSNTAVLILAA